MLLGDLGAQVTRVDRPGRAGSLTGLPLEDDPRTRGHRGIGIDLRGSAGRAVLLRLVERADVFLEGMRPGAAEKLGLGPDDLLDVNPGLVYGRATGWGQSGRAPPQAGHDINYAAVAGGVFPLGPAGRAAAAAAEPARRLRRRAAPTSRSASSPRCTSAGVTGRGQVVDAAMVDGVASLTTMLHGMLAAGLWSDRRGDNLLDGAAPLLPHVPRPRTAASWPSAPLSRSSTANCSTRSGLTTANGRSTTGPGGRSSPAGWPAIFASRTRAEWEQVFAGRDACVTPVLSLAEAAASAELRDRGTFVDWGGVPQPAPAPRLSASAVIERPRSRWCGHTDQVLAELGYQADEIAGLRAAERSPSGVQALSAADDGRSR